MHKKATYLVVCNNPADEQLPKSDSTERFSSVLGVTVTGELFATAVWMSYEFFPPFQASCDYNVFPFFDMLRSEMVSNTFRAALQDAPRRPLAVLAVSCTMISLLEYV